MAAHARPGNESRNPVLGIAMMLVAVLCFACMDVATKYLSQTYNVPLVLAFRYAVAAGLMAVLIWPRTGRAMVTFQRKGVVAARSLTMVVSSLMAAYAMKRMPVAETVAIIYLAPFAVLLLAGPVLGEKVKLSSWLATIGGFAGLILIVRPGGGLDPGGVGFAMLAAFGATWYFLFTRLLASTEGTLALLFAVNVAGTVCFGLALPWTFYGPAPTLIQIGVFLFAGAAAVIGHYMLTAAYREAAASILAPLNYVHLIWAGLLGWLVFDHIPDFIGGLGIGLIAVSGGALAVWTQVAGRRRLRPPTN